MYKPTKIIYNGVATVVFWNDGTKTVVKRAADQEDDKYGAFCAALAIKTYGSNSALKRTIKKGENGKEQTDKNYETKPRISKPGQCITFDTDKRVWDLVGVFTFEQIEKIYEQACYNKKIWG